VVVGELDPDFLAWELRRRAALPAPDEQRAKLVGVRVGGVASRDIEQASGAVSLPGSEGAAGAGGSAKSARPVAAAAGVACAPSSADGVDPA
jgi:hypothetical protein